MSQPRIKTKKTDGPLDWIRTDDKSMVECFYILLMTRGLYPVLESLVEALSLDADFSRNERAEAHPGWIRDAEFCEQAAAVIGDAAAMLHGNWNGDGEQEAPHAARRKEPTVGAIYMLPGGGIYMPKKK